MPEGETALALSRCVFQVVSDTNHLKNDKNGEIGISKDDCIVTLYALQCNQGGGVYGKDCDIKS